MRSPNFFCIIAVLALVPCRPWASAQEVIDLTRLLEGMLDRSQIAEFPEPAFVCKQASSYNRRSKTPGNADWFAGSDFDQFLGCVETEGRREWIMLEAEGPGVVTRWWQTQYRGAGTIRIYLDRTRKPIFAGTGDELVGGNAIVGPPLAANRGGGRNLYLPIPFLQHCRITFESSNPDADFTNTKPGFTSESLFYIINYLQYPAGTKVKTLNKADLDSSRDLIARVGRVLLSPEKHPLPFTRKVEGGKRALKPGQMLTRRADGGGALAVLRLRITAADTAQAMRSTVITATFDGQRTIWAPVGEFFGSGLGLNPYQTWWRKVEKDGWMTCWWPMPFRRAAEIAVVNHGTSDSVIVELDDIGIADWEWTDRTMVFHTAWRGENLKEFVGDDFANMEAWNYITIEGRGVYVGDSLSLYNRPRMNWGRQPWIGPWWGEGDEQIWVDGESFPSHFGTGSEDYFGYAFNHTRPFDAPFHAQPIAQGNWGVGHTTNVRDRVHDRIPFQTRFKFDMELFHWQPKRRVDYATTTHWYAFDGATHNGEASPNKVRETIAQPWEGSPLEEVYAPAVVGTPPVNAFNGLFLCPDGEIRHYGGGGFLSSRDHGLTWRHRKFGEQNDADKAAGGGRPLGMNPQTRTCLRMVSGTSGTFIHRSTDGPDGEYAVQKIDDARVIMVRPPIFLSSRPRVLFAGHSTGAERPYRITVFRSDDDGVTWTKSVLPPGPAFDVRPPHRGPRWENWCVEPTILELKSGRLWMLARTSRDRHHECFSHDAGESWSAWRPSRFYGTLTMPTLFRLRDGRVLLFWCNTTPLPEIDRREEPIPESAKNGRWEDVFTNRDACHVAISEDDGQTWIGFREMRLNPLRNADDLGRLATHDFSVHQAQAIELPGSKVLVAHGQDAAVRALVRFDPSWLYEPRRRSDFANGLDDWSTHKYVKGIVGHCSYNRVPGARLIPHPDKPGTRARVLHLRHPIDPRLVFDKDGAAWNFPAAVKGFFTTRIKLLAGGGGARICLVDRWFNPTDPVVSDYAMYALTIRGDCSIGQGGHLTVDRWHDLRLTWNDSRSSTCRLAIDGKMTPIELPLVRPSANGISYVHFQVLSEKEDTIGFLVESVEGGR